MEKFTVLILRKRAMAVCALLLISTFGYCATFVAVASGNWSSSGTWGGSAPSFNISSDQIAIASGITVTLDNSLVINGSLASLSVLGTLEASDTTSLHLGLGAIIGTGELTVGTLILDSNSLFAFTGSVVTQTFATASTGEQLADSLTVNNTLMLSGGILTLANGGVLTLSNNATINVGGGTVVPSGGTFNLSLAYNLIYSNTSATTGVEATSTHLNNVTINVPDGSTVTLSGDLIVQGTLSLQSGSLSLNGHALNIVGNIATGGSGNIMSTPSSNITVSSTSPPAGALTFAAGANTLNSLQVNVGGFAATVQIASNLEIDGMLQFVSGSLDIGNNQLSLGSAATITGQSPSSYIITGDSGTLSMGLTAGLDYIQYPVGTSSHYNPAMIQLAAGSASGNVQVGTTNGVDSAGTTGTDLSITQPMVDATWMVHSDISSNLNLNMKLEWSASMELNHFNRDSAYISHYSAAHWDTGVYESAALASGPLYAIERVGLTSLSPFAIFGTGNATTAINPITPQLEFEIYPNPATGDVTISNPALSGKVNMEIINLQGQIVATYVLNNLTTDVQLNKLASGNYFVRFYNDETATMKKLVKL